MVKSPTLFEGLIMENATRRRCRRVTDAGVYCSSRAADIMARALNPRFGGRQWKVGRPDPVRPLGSSGQQRLFL